MLEYQYDKIVVGGGVSGIFAAIAAGRDGSKVALIEATDRLGGAWGLSAVQYLHETPAAVKFLDDRGIPFERRKVRADVVYNYESPGVWTRAYLNRAAFGSDQATMLDIQRRHYAKSRGTLDGFSETTMNEFSGDGAVALDFDMDMAKRLLCRRADVRYNARLSGYRRTAKGGGSVQCEFKGDGPPFAVLANELVLAIPFDGSKAKDAVDDKSQVRYYIVNFGAASVAMPYAGLDYAYTVDTPFNAIYRISRMMDGSGRWLAESRADVEPDLGYNDIWAIFGPGAHTESTFELNTRVRISDDHTEPEKNVTRIGRAATGDPRWLLHKTIEAIETL